LVLFFNGYKGTKDSPVPVTGDGVFQVEFINESEVAANFMPTFTTTAGTAAVQFYDAADSAHGTELVGAGGIVLAPNETKTIDVVIKTSTFSGLKIGARCEQVD